MTFTTYGFDFPKLFKDQNIKDLVTDYGSYFPNPIKVFYSNLSFKNSKLCSNVKANQSL